MIKGPRVSWYARRCRVEPGPWMRILVRVRASPDSIQCTMVWEPVRTMENRFWPAIGAFALLAILAASTLSGSVRAATLFFLGGLAVKTYIALLRLRQESADQVSDADDKSGDDDSRTRVVRQNLPS